MGLKEEQKRIIEFCYDKNIVDLDNADNIDDAIARLGATCAVLEVYNKLGGIDADEYLNALNIVSEIYNNRLKLFGVILNED